MFLKTIFISCYLLIALLYFFTNICFCDSLEIEESNSSKDEESDSKEASKEAPKENILSRIWNFPILTTKFFTIKASHIVKSVFYVAIYFNGVNDGMALIYNESYSPLLKRIIRSPHQAFTIIDEQSAKDKFLRQAIEIARKMRRDSI